MSPHLALIRSASGAALARAEAFLLEPQAGLTPAPEPTTTVRHPVVAVCGLAPGCGTTTVARGLAAALAERDSVGAAVCASHESPAGIAPGSGHARKLATALRVLALDVRPRGRVCLTAQEGGRDLAHALHHLAPLVLAVSAGAAAQPAVGVADHAVLVGSSGVEPALAGVAREALTRAGTPALVVLNRGSGAGGRWEAHAQAVLPDSRSGARIALAGRMPQGALGRALAELAGRCAEPTR